MEWYLRVVLAVGATTLLALGAGPAAGQYGPPQTQQMPSGATARVQRQAATPAAAQVEPTPQSALVAAAACLIDRDPAAGPALLATAPYSPAERNQAIQTIRNAERCARQENRFATSAVVMRGAVAEAMYENAFVAPPPPRSPAATAADWFNPALATAQPDGTVLAPTFALGLCAAAAQPGLVGALLATESGTEAEMAALNALNPAFSRCVARGQPIQADRAGLRAILAESLYRWSVVQRDGPGSPMAAATTPAPAASN